MKTFGYVLLDLDGNLVGNWWMKGAQKRTFGPVPIFVGDGRKQI
jgi:hypothetical protein